MHKADLLVVVSCAIAARVSAVALERCGCRTTLSSR
jgi:hypothetical protein